MPENKRAKLSREREKVHTQVAAAAGFRLKDIPATQRIQTAKCMDELESMGFILFVPGVGWVDSTPAIRRNLSQNPNPRSSSKGFYTFKSE